jgi:tetratricopeptide (TPR) repeat protein
VEKIGELIGDPGLEERARARAVQSFGEKKTAKPAAEPPPRPKPKPEPAKRAAPPRPPAPPREPTIRFMDWPTPPDEGEFTPDVLGQLLVRLQREKFTGLVEVAHEAERKNVYWTDGKPVFVQSTIPEESLGRMLLTDGVITEEQYKEAMVEMAETNKKFGTILANRGIVSSEDLYYHLVSQTRLKIARCFTWPSGQFRLNRQTKYPAEATMFESDPLAIVIEGYRRHAPAGPLEQVYESHKGYYLFLGEPNLVAAARLHLSPHERELLNVANGTRTLGEVVGDSPLGLLPALRVVHALVVAGAIRLGQVEKQPDLEPYETPPPPEIDPPEADPRRTDRYRELKALFVRMEDLDHFELLGVDRDADEEVVRHAFVELEKKFHPDTFTVAAPERVHRMAVTVSRRLHQAYDVLREPESREQYVRALAVKQPAAPAEAEPPAEEMTKPRAAAMRFQEALVASEKRRHGLAIEHLQKAVELEPKNAEYRAKLAQTMFKYLEDPGVSWDDVEQAAKSALTLDPGRADLMALMGRVKTKQGDPEKALKYFKKAVELDPHNADYKRDAHYAEQKARKDPKKKPIFGKRS